MPVWTVNATLTLTIPVALDVEALDEEAARREVGGILEQDFRIHASAAGLEVRWPPECGATAQVDAQWVIEVAPPTDEDGAGPVPDA